MVWACSDAYHAIFGYRLAQDCESKCVVDLYDNFEAFRATKLPSVLPLFKHAVKRAEGVTCFSQCLAERIVRDYLRTKPTVVIESGANTRMFRPKDRTLCRQELGLPEDAMIIGMAGALHRSRDIHSLFRAFQILAAQDSRLHLAVAGPRAKKLQITTTPRIHDFKILPHEQIPAFINSLDLAVIGYANSAQGRYSFPQKAYEILACRVPLIAAAVGTMADLLKHQPACLFEPENPESLAAAVRRQLQNRVVLDIPVPSWDALARRLERFFTFICKDNSARPMSF